MADAPQPTDIHAQAATVSKESLHAAPQESGNLQGNLAGSVGRWWHARWALRDGGPTFANIWARDIDDARRICGKLGFEEPKPARRSPSEFRVSRLANSAPDGLAHPDVLHTLCYLSTLAARAGAVTAEELVADGSPLHELSHYLGLGSNVRHGRMREFVMERITWLESLIPGMPPAELALEVGARMPGHGRIAEQIIRDAPCTTQCLTPRTRPMSRAIT